MNLTDRIYLAVHAGLTLLVCIRHEYIARWPYYVAWNLAAMAVILLLARVRSKGEAWEFAHDFFPGFVLFTTVFEEVSFLCLTVVGHWQNQYLIAAEKALFSVAPSLWLHQHAVGWTVELLHFGYLAFYPMYPIVGVLFWSRRKRPGYRFAFRDMTDALSIGYLISYITFIAWPTESPRHAGTALQIDHTSVCGWLVELIQSNGGVHGNAFPSAHIMLAFVLLVFTWRYWRRAAPWILLINLLMCLGAVYDGYHYTVDVIAGAVLGTVVAAVYLRCTASRREA